METEECAVPDNSTKGNRQYARGCIHLIGMITLDHNATRQYSKRPGRVTMQTTTIKTIANAEYDGERTTEEGTDM
jgi:hypothetical protein